MTVTPIDLYASPIDLDRAGRVRPDPQGRETDGWRLTAFHAKTGDDVHEGGWQAHAEADELVSCLVGKIRVLLRPEEPGQADEEIRLTAGTAAVIPRGREHRITPDIPSVVLAATLPSAAPADPLPTAS
ncbi:hypothetical protein GCM10022221_28850 [Actinocorallia aurea]